MGLGIAEGEGMLDSPVLRSLGLENSPWRLMFLIGAIPALLALVIRRRLKEPERWQNVSHQGAVTKQLGSYRELFSHPVWRRHALLGLVLACSGVIGLWAVGFYTPDLIRQVQSKPLTKAVYEREIAAAKVAGDTGRESQLDRIYGLWQDGKEGETPEELAETKRKVDSEIKRTLTVYQSYTSIAINVGAFLGMFSFGVV
jgi:hypothetical protein